MSRLARLVAVIAGLAFPVALALAVYVASAGSLAEPVEGTQLPSETIARPTPAKKVPMPTTTTTPRATTNEDVSGPCDEAEHANDPRCTGAATDDDDGSGSGSSGSSDDSSGSGSGSSDDSSGGDDDSSGRGRGRSGSSGSGSSGSGDD